MYIGAYLSIFEHIWAYLSIFEHIWAYLSIFEHIWPMKKGSHWSMVSHSRRRWSGGRIHIIFWNFSGWVIQSVPTVSQGCPEEQLEKSWSPKLSWYENRSHLQNWKNVRCTVVYLTIQYAALEFCWLFNMWLVSLKSKYHKATGWEDFVPGFMVNQHHYLSGLHEPNFFLIFPMIHLKLRLL